MFKKEILRSLSGIKIAWYPNEGVCLVLKGKSTRTYRKVPKKYSILFEDIKNKSSRKEEKCKQN